MNITDLKGLDAILGMDMLECMGATIDVVNGTLTFHDGEMIKLIRHIDRSAHLCCEDQVRLKAMQARVVTTRPMAGTTLPDDMDQGIVEPLDSLFKENGLITATSLVRRVRGRFMVYIMNPNTFDLMLPKNMPMATIEPIALVAEESSDNFTRLAESWFAQDDDDIEVAKGDSTQQKA